MAQSLLMTKVKLGGSRLRVGYSMSFTISKHSSTSFGLSVGKVDLGIKHTKGSVMAGNGDFDFLKVTEEDTVELYVIVIPIQGEAPMVLKPSEDAVAALCERLRNPPSHEEAKLVLQGFAAQYGDTVKRIMH